MLNKTIPFGYHSFGGYTIIKLNMNLSPDDATMLRNKYDISVCYNGKRNKEYLYRIEACFSHSNSTNFYNDLQVCKINAKMYILACKKADLLDSVLSRESAKEVDLYLPF